MSAEQLPSSGSYVKKSAGISSRSREECYERLVRGDHIEPLPPADCVRVQHNRSRTARGDIVQDDPVRLGDGVFVCDPIGAPELTVERNAHTGRGRNDFGLQKRCSSVCAGFSSGIPRYPAAINAKGHAFDGFAFETNL